MNITSKTRVLGVIGDPVAHSFSPLMHNAAIAALSEDYAYVAFHVLPENVGHAIDGMRALGIRGLNVTIPHKQAVMEYLDKISEEALAVGAVNTISLEDGDLVGYNTDVYGLSTALERVAGLQQFPECCVVLGAGGAARAAVYALATRQEVRTVRVLNRTFARAESLAKDMQKITGKYITAAVLDKDPLLAHLADAGLVVNTTSLGMFPHVEGSALLNEKALHAGLVLYDTVFNPMQTRLMSQFQSVGASAYGGLEMLVYQGARSFQIWTGTEPSSDVMKQAIVGRFQS